MRVNKITFKGFRGIKDQEFALSPNQTTVLIGENGSGKSSIIESVAKLFSIIFSNFESLSISRKGHKFANFIDSDITAGLNFTEIKISAKWDEKEIIWGILKERFINKCEVVNQEAAINELKNIYPFEAQSLRRSYITKLMSNVPFVMFYPTNRSVNQIFKKENKSKNGYFFEQLQIFDDSFQNFFDFNTFFNWFKKREDYENEKRLDDNDAFRDYELETVRQAIQNFLPNYSNPRIRRKKDINVENFVINKNGVELIIDQLSHGEKTLFAMIGDISRRLAMANPNSNINRPLDGKAIILIDEIELHLHPKWQRTIIPSLERTFPNCQFIVATHSPQVISHAQRGSVFLIENGEIHPVKDSFGRDSNWILETIMEAPERPEEIKNQLTEYFKLIDANKLDKAEQVRKILEELIGKDEPELTKADILIHRKKLLANEKNHKK